MVCAAADTLTAAATPKRSISLATARVALFIRARMLSPASLSISLLVANAGRRKTRQNRQNVASRMPLTILLATRHTASTFYDSAQQAWQTPFQRITHILTGVKLQNCRVTLDATTNERRLRNASGREGWKVDMAA